jgi:hypothetical protein
MPKRIFKRFTPDRDTIKNQKQLRMFGKLLHDPNIWHMNRRSVSGAFAVGLFWAFAPMPFQMVAAAAAAIAFRVNLPISVALVWLTNPITIPPIFYSTYLLGTWILDLPPQQHQFELSVEWMTTSLSEIWQPLLLGSLICGIIAAILGYLTIRGFWRWHVGASMRRRKARRNKNS